MKRFLRVAAWSIAVLAFLGLWLFPDAISRFRQSRSGYFPGDPSCDAARGPCSVAIGEDDEVRLEVKPKGAPAARPLVFLVEVDGEAQAKAIELQGVDMNMGFFRFPLHPAGEPGRWGAEGVLPVCTLDRMAWRADVVLDEAVAGFVLWSRSR